MRNAEIARYFDELADLLEIDGANPFRVRAYRTAARNIGDYAGSIAGLAEEGPKALQSLPGIGADIAAKIVTIIETSQLPQLLEMRQKVPPGVVAMLRIPGLGVKKAATIAKELGVQSLDDLRAAAAAGQIASLKGFGLKTEQMILAGIENAASWGTRYLMARVLPEATAIVDDLSLIPSVAQASVAGSLRRMKETCADLDVVAADVSSQPAMDRLAEHRLVVKTLSRGDTKMRVELQSGVELDLRVVPAESFGAALQYFTGSKEHNVTLRRLAQEQDLRLNEYGLVRGDERIAGAKEEDVYAALGLHWIPPELREDRGEIDAARRGPFPPMLETRDILGDLHMHTTASDGTASIRDMAEAARDRGLKYIAITDHSQRVTMANGLTAARLRAHWLEIERVRAEVRGIEILRGIECDILEDATLDLPDDVLAEADWVIAVLHYGLRQPQKQIMRRLLNAMKNPHVDIIGHPSGRMLTRREGADIEWEPFLDAAAESGVMLELNANPARLDMDDIHAAAAKARGIPIVISTDAHSTEGLDRMECGVFQARRAGLQKQDVANTRGLAEFRRLMRK